MLYTKDNKKPVITGSFIQESLVENWDDSMWQKELCCMKEAGLKILVFAIANERENGEYVINYKTNIPMLEKYYTGRDLLENCLRNCEKNGIRVFVGLNASDRWWLLYDLYENWMFQQMGLGNQIASDIYQSYKFRYPDTFYGWYWNFELFNMPMISRNCPERQAHLERIVRALNINLDHLNLLDPSMPTMLSPFANDRLTSLEEQEEFWSYLVENAHFKPGDILCPQDAVGAGWTSIDNLNQWFGSYKKAVSRKPEIKLWANNENFVQSNWSSAPLDRFIRQLEITDPYVENHITFSYNHYYSPLHIQDGFHRAYCHYLKSGSLPDEAPAEPEKICFQELDNETVLIRWDCPNMSNVAGFRIFRDGLQIGECKLKVCASWGDKRYLPKAERHYLDEMMIRDQAVYSIESFSFCGKVSKKIKKGFTRI